MKTAIFVLTLALASSIAFAEVDSGHSQSGYKCKTTLKIKRTKRHSERENTIREAAVKALNSKGYEVVNSKEAERGTVIDVCPQIFAPKCDYLYVDLYLGRQLIISTNDFTEDTSHKGLANLAADIINKTVSNCE